MNDVHGSTVALAALASALGCSEAAGTPAEVDQEGEATLWTSPSPKPTVVLVHGAFADGTGWQHVIPLLEKRGYPVIAVQNPLTSVADDIATTKRVLDAESQKGPVIAVAHSFGGVAITGAAAGNLQVKALVYLNAFAPDAGEVLGELASRYPGVPLEALVPDAAGFLYIDRARFQDLFCADIPRTEARVLAAAQKPLSSGVFTQMLDQAAWKTIPSWYLLGHQDRIVVPDLQRFMATRAGAKLTEIDSSHVSFISHPKVVVRLIEEAAVATVK
jgi:pimeloyl-ACP methyl ester carboxylesterase